MMNPIVYTQCCELAHMIMVTCQLFLLNSTKTISFMVFFHKLVLNDHRHSKDHHIGATAYIFHTFHTILYMSILTLFSNQDGLLYPAHLIQRLS